MDGDAALAAELLEVPDRQEPDVRAVVPFVTEQARRFGRPALAQEHLRQLVIAEVRETDDALPADAQHVRDDLLDVAHRLKRVREHHEIELRVLERGQAVVEVGLSHVQPAPDAGQHGLLIQFDPGQPRVPSLAQPGQQCSVAAAKIEHARRRRDQFRNQIIVQPARMKNAGRTLRVEIVVVRVPP